MNKREQYEKENGLDVYASMENYGSFKDEYVKWLELELDNNDVLGDVVCSFIKQAALSDNVPLHEAYIQYDESNKDIDLYREDDEGTVSYVRTLK